MSVIATGDVVKVFASPAWEGEPFELSIMGEDVAEFLRLHLELTGMEATANVFVLILHYYRWRHTAAMVGGQQSAVGWAFIPSTIPH